MKVLPEGQVFVWDKECVLEGVWCGVIWCGCSGHCLALLTCLKDLVHLLHKDGVERGEVPT